MRMGEQMVRVIRGIPGGRRYPLVAMMMVATVSAGWTFFCPERMTAGSTSLVLVAEELLMDNEPGEGTIVGIYRSSGGGTLSISCSSEDADYDQTGASA